MRETIDFAARVQGVGVRPAELEALLAKGGQPAEPTEAEIHAFLEVNLVPGCLRHYTTILLRKPAGPTEAGIHAFLEVWNVLKLVLEIRRAAACRLFLENLKIGAAERGRDPRLPRSESMLPPSLSALVPWIFLA